MQYDFSVIVLSYHPDREKLLATLRSALMQRDVSFEIIVADDGSPAFFEEDIRRTLDGKVDYRILAHERNQGTVKNLLDAVSVAKGRYIKPISPGDYLYDGDTLKTVTDFMDEKNAPILFGDMVYYAWEDGLKLFDRKTPYDDGMYLAENTNFSCRKAAKHQMVYNDNISGAAVFYERETMLWGLSTISSAVRYAEDTMLQLALLADKRIYRIPRFVVWYEYGSGISTNGALGFSSRLTEDFCRFYGLLRSVMPNAPYVRRTDATWRLLKKGRIGNLARKCLELDKHLFRLRKEKLASAYHLGTVDEQNILCIIRDSEKESQQKGDHRTSCETCHGDH